MILQKCFGDVSHVFREYTDFSIVNASQLFDWQLLYDSSFGSISRRTSALEYLIKVILLSPN